VHTEQVRICSAPVLAGNRRTPDAKASASVGGAQMEMTVVNWPLVISLIAISAVALWRRSSGSATEPSDLASRVAHRGDGSMRPQPEPGLELILPAIVFFLVSGVGAATLYMSEAPSAMNTVDTGSSILSDSDLDDEMLLSLTDYTQSIGAGEPSFQAPGEMLPDVSTMIERLAARLNETPGDIKGWQMLGWSYFNIGHYEEAAAAYAKALELDPSSDDLKRVYAETKQLSEGRSLQTASISSPGHAGKVDDGPSAETIASFEAMPARERDAAIRSMVDGLADRLQTSPRDVEGWTRLIRSRVVLGQTDLAATALRKALDVFKDDSAASSKIMASANQLGLKAE